MNKTVLYRPVSFLDLCVVSQKLAKLEGKDARAGNVYMSTKCAPKSKRVVEPESAVVDHVVADLEFPENEWRGYAFNSGVIGFAWSSGTDSPATLRATREGSGWVLTYEGPESGNESSWYLLAFALAGAHAVKGKSIRRRKALIHFLRDRADGKRDKGEAAYASSLDRLADMVAEVELPPRQAAIPATEPTTV